MATLICATIILSGAKLGIDTADYLWDKNEIGDSHYKHYNYLGRFHPMNIEINRGSRA